MLRELHIHNLAVIEDAHIEFSHGLNCFTGQTGAGKSLIMGAFEILLGLRPASAQVLRPGAQEARVAGVFELHDQDIARQAGELLDQPLQAGDELLISRRILPTGRSSLTVNAQPCTAAMLRSVGQLLVDIHGQHDQQYLLKPANQLLILDAFSKATSLRQEYEQLQQQHRQLRHRRRELASSRTLRQQQLELYEYQANEIAEAKLQPGEMDRLRQRHAMLSNIQRIGRDAQAALQTLDESDDAITPRLRHIVRMMADLEQLDPELRTVSQQIQSAAAFLEDASYDLSRYMQNLELDPQECAEIDARLNVLNRLAARYASAVVREPGAAGDAPLPGDVAHAVLAYHKQIVEMIHQLRGEDDDLVTIDQRIGQVTAQLQDVARRLTRKRQAGARRLRPLVEQQLQELGMAQANFDVAFQGTPGNAPQQEGAPDGADDDAARAAESFGVETAEMVVRTNPGQPMLPLRKIASGGEMSRIMLALESILAQASRVSVLVFDEIDANIGGRMGSIIGQKLRALTRNASHQVLCITHLPQIAAYADRHLHITKHSTGRGAKGSTTTTIDALQGEQRVDELAQMLAGHDTTATTRSLIHEMLALAG